MEDNCRGAFWGLLAGLAVGLAIGFLYAPRSGKEPRETLKEKAFAVKEKAEKAYSRAKSRISEMRHKGGEAPETA